MQNIFSYPLKLEDMSTAVKQYKIKATKNELHHITEIMKVPEIKFFEAEISVRLRKKDHLVDILGTVKADVLQVSVISLEKFVQQYQTSFERHVDTKMTLEEQIALEEETDDVPDILENGQIDLAAIAMEQLALVLDDFPRQKGEQFIFHSEFDEETTQKNNPFAILEKLKK